MRKSVDTETRIIQAALELFVRQGYHGTSVNDITERVGLTKGALYAHFKSKGQLLLTLIEEFRTRFIGGMRAALEECTGHALGRLHRVISFNSKFAVDHEDLCVFLSFLTTELNADVDFQPALKQVYREYQSVIAEIIADGTREGFFKPNLDPEISALSFMALHDGVLHQWVLNRDLLNGEQYVRTFREIFLYGLVNHKRRAALD